MLANAATNATYAAHSSVSAAANPSRTVGTASSRTRSVAAIANTPSLNASTRVLSLSRFVGRSLSAIDGSYGPRRHDAGPRWAGMSGEVPEGPGGVTGASVTAGARARTRHRRGAW